MYTAKEIAESLNGHLIGDEEIRIFKPAKIEDAEQGDISFIANGKYEAYASSSKASVLLVSKEFKDSNSNGKTIIKVNDVYEALPKLLQQFDDAISNENSISHRASISEDTIIGEKVNVGDFTCIHDQVTIGDNTIIESNCFIGRNVTIGTNTYIHPGVRIYNDCVIGANCIIHSNVVIGSDGFGFAMDAHNRFTKIPQIGNVIIEDNVEIGANSVIDRGTMGSTIIKNGVKLDNLIQVAHNVEIGENTVIAAQSGIAGSTKVGKNCKIGGQVGIVGHITIADGSQIQGQSGVAASITVKNQKWYGYPAISYFKYLRAFSVFKILPNLLKRIQDLEDKTSTNLND